jgi:hypothetical protein
MSDDITGAYGNTLVQTPHIGSLAAKGITLVRITATRRCVCCTDPMPISQQVKPSDRSSQ